MWDMSARRWKAGKIFMQWKLLVKTKSQRNSVQDILIRNNLLLMMVSLVLYVIFLSQKVQWGIIPDSGNDCLETKFLSYTDINVHHIKYKVESWSIFFKKFIWKDEKFEISGLCVSAVCVTAFVFKFPIYPLSKFPSDLSWSYFH